MKPLLRVLLLLLFSFSFFLDVHCEYTVGSFVVQDKLTPIAEYGFVENGTLDISMNTMPEINNNIKVVVCSEREQAKLMALEPSKLSGCQVHKSVNCSVHELNRGGTVHVVAGAYGQHTLSVLLCDKPGVTVNFSCLSTNPSPFHFFPSSSSSSSSSVGSDPRSHLGSQLLPVVATEQVAGLMWAGVALAYLFTLRQYWRRARLLQKIIAAYPIAKVAFAYYSGTLFSHYSEFGYFTASQWAGYWTFSILLKTSLALLLMAITVCSTNFGSKLKLNDVAIVIGLLVGIVIVSALECSMELSQLSSLILWMVELVLYVLMMSFLLIGVTSGLSKTGSILRSVIRRNTSETRRRVISNRNLRESQSRVNPPSSDDNNNNESAENSSPAASQEHTSSDQRNTGLNEPNNTTEQNNDVELRPQESEFHPVDLQERAHASPVDVDNTSINVATGEVDPSLDGRGLLDSLTPSQLTNLNNSIAYLLPYIWFTRFNLFASFKFVLLFWVFLQILAFFINLVPGTGIDELNWLGLMTTEILDFIVFAGVTYTFLMSSRYPFSDSMTQRTSHRRSHRGRHDPEDHPLLPDDQDQDQEQANQAADQDGDLDLEHDLDSEADELELELEEQNNNNNEATTLSLSQQISGLPSRGPGLEIQEEEEEEEDDEEKLLARSASTSLAKK